MLLLISLLIDQEETLRKAQRENEEVDKKETQADTREKDATEDKDETEQEVRIPLVFL